MIVQNEFRTLFKYLKFSLCEAEKFYCEINYFIYELTSRLLRDKFFYLRVEFFLLRRGFCLLSREFIFVPLESPFTRMTILSIPQKVYRTEIILILLVTAVDQLLSVVDFPSG